jgi:glycosyltransferase involved in cell wall biosynthesis
VRIALLSFEYPEETGFGGIGAYTRCQARALAALGNTVEVVAGARAARPLEPVVEEGVRLWRIAGGGAARRAFRRALSRLGLHWSCRRLENGLDMRRALAEMTRRGIEIDVVETPESGAEGLFLPAPWAVRRLLRIHSPAAAILPFYEASAADRRLAARLERRAAAGAAACSAPTRFVAETARRLFEPTAPIELAPYPVEIGPPVARAAARAELALPADRRLVLFVGRLERRKGFAVAVEAMLRLLAERPEVDFACAGEDPFGELARAAVPRFARAGLGGRLRALGRLAAAPLARWRAATDVVLLPSLWDNAPYAMLEAMAAGVPVVAARVGGIPEIAEDGREALLAPPGDGGATAAAVGRLLDDAALAARLAAAARERVAREFAPADVAARSLAHKARHAAGGGPVR